MQAMPVAVATHLFCTDGSLVKAALASTSPADILLHPTFNPVGGYASYIVPAAFVRILQQNLLIGASMLTVVALGAAAETAIDGAILLRQGRGLAYSGLSYSRPWRYLSSDLAASQRLSSSADRRWEPLAAQQTRARGFPMALCASQTFGIA